jgi:hypothetical protein
MFEERSFDELVPMMPGPAASGELMLQRLERVGPALSRLVMSRCRLGDEHMACIGRLETLRCVDATRSCAPATAATLRLAYQRQSAIPTVSDGDRHNNIVAITCPRLRGASAGALSIAIHPWCLCLLPHRPLSCCPRQAVVQL